MIMIFIVLLFVRNSSKNYLTRDFDPFPINGNFNGTAVILCKCVAVLVIFCESGI